MWKRPPRSPNHCFCSARADLEAQLHHLEDSEIPPQNILSQIFPHPLPAFLEEGNKKTQNEPKQFDSISSPLTITAEGSNYSIILLHSKLNCAELRIFIRFSPRNLLSQQTQEETKFLLQPESRIGNCHRGELFLPSLKLTSINRTFWRENKEKIFTFQTSHGSGLETQNAMGLLAHLVQKLKNKY